MELAAFPLGVFYGGAIVGIPVTTGVAQGVSEQKKQNEAANNEERMVKFHLDVASDASALDGRMIVLRDDKVWLAKKDPKTKLPLPEERGHPFTGFFIQYPDDERKPPELGLVSTISVDPPMLNWIYMDKDTQELRYGNRTQSISHTVGPWDWAEEDHVAILLQEFEGFVAVEEEPGQWAVYFDANDDGLQKGKKVKGKKCVEIGLDRRCFDEEQQKRDMQKAEDKMRVKTSGDLKAQWD